jgi:hypothetical protein
MTDDIDALLERQTRWQRSRKDLSWAEKLRLAAVIRDSIVRLRRTAVAGKPHTPRKAVPTRR